MLISGCTGGITIRKVTIERQCVCTHPVVEWCIYGKMVKGTKKVHLRYTAASKPREWWAPTVPRVWCLYCLWTRWSYNWARWARWGTNSALATAGRAIGVGEESVTYSLGWPQLWPHIPRASLPPRAILMITWGCHNQNNSEGKCDLWTIRYGPCWLFNQIFNNPYNIPQSDFHE